MRSIYSLKITEYLYQQMLYFLRTNIWPTINSEAKIVLWELFTDEIILPLTNVVIKQSVEITSQYQSHILLCHSGGVIRLPICYCNESETRVAITDSDIHDPLTYKSVKEHTDKEKWQEVMKLEIE